jgi:putative DNA primase/helicase
VIATGHQAAVIASGGDKYNDGEFEKRLSAALLGGDQVIALDNMERAVGGQLLNQILTQPAVSIRPFRTLDNVVVPCTSCVFCNGNNLVVEGDTTRRTLVSTLRPGVERPELLKFDFDPVEVATRDRRTLLVCALTVLRGWIVAEASWTGKLPAPLGSYEGWSRLVRNALIWLGEADPVEVMEKTRESDPKLANLRTMIRAWYCTIGSGKTTKVRDVVRRAEESDERGDSDLLDAIRTAVPEGQVVTKALGWWLRRNRGRVVYLDASGHNMRFVQEQGEQNHASGWKLEDLDDGDDQMEEKVDDYGKI